MRSNTGYSLEQQPMNKQLRLECTQDCGVKATGLLECEWRDLGRSQHRADEGEATHEAASERKGGRNGIYPEKTRRPAASSGTIPNCENPKALTGERRRPDMFLTGDTMLLACAPAVGKKSGCCTSVFSHTPCLGVLPVVLLTGVTRRPIRPNVGGNPDNPIIKSGDTAWHCSSESVVSIQNSITPLDCQRIKEYVTLSEDCEASGVDLCHIVTSQWKQLKLIEISDLDCRPPEVHDVLRTYCFVTRQLGYLLAACDNQGLLEIPPNLPRSITALGFSITALGFSFDYLKRLTDDCVLAETFPLPEHNKSQRCSRLQNIENLQFFFKHFVDYARGYFEKSCFENAFIAQNQTRMDVKSLFTTQRDMIDCKSFYTIKDILLSQYQVGCPLVDDGPIMSAVKYRIVSGAVWINRKMQLNKCQLINRPGGHGSTKQLEYAGHELRHANTGRHYVAVLEQARRSDKLCSEALKIRITFVIGSFEMLHVLSVWPRITDGHYQRGLVLISSLIGVCHWIFKQRQAANIEIIREALLPGDSANRVQGDDCTPGINFHLVSTPQPAMQAAPECKYGGNWRYPRKPAHRRHRPARKYGSDPAGNRTRFAMVESEWSNQYTTATPGRIEEAYISTGEKQDVPEKTRRLAASSGTIPQSGIEPDLLVLQNTRTRIHFRDWMILTVTHCRCLPANHGHSVSKLPHCDWPSQDKIDVKHVYTGADFAITSQFIRHALDDSEPMADLQGNK
ncbi:hypothetical protein PR048_027243 [Dryococelus australis]|uniref:Uncharacterized protein n=1 Tax=Dryococelus australis TaxID=614101 RepID=A0ABQ9GG83_9NEOP|nr:hypothetical protein PR048_027243 [Dryococelus australis]